MAKMKSKPTKRPSSKKPGSVRPQRAPKQRERQIATGDMPLATTARIEANNHERQAIRRAITTQREKIATTYRAQFKRFAARRENVPKTIFAEGDSWFNYPLGHAVISQLQSMIHTPIANFAWPGAETRQLLALHERKEIAKRLVEGPEAGKKWDVLLFSGGGDDIVGDQMVLFLDRYDPTKPADAVLNARFEEVLDLVMGAYRDLVSLRDALSRQTLIVAHVYDYAWATNQGACWLGPWLRPSLDYVGVPQGDLQHEVVKAMLDRFESNLHEVAATTTNFIVVPTHNTLKTANEWANELHPKDPGFVLIAQKFQAALQRQFGANI